MLINNNKLARAYLLKLNYDYLCQSVDNLNFQIINMERIAKINVTPANHLRIIEELTHEGKSHIGKLKKREVLKNGIECYYMRK